MVRFLTREEEHDLALRYRDSGDVAAMHRIVESYIPFGRKFATRFRWTGIPMEDLEAEAAIGLLEAIQKFDPDSGHRFSTYAAFWLQAVLGDLARRMTGAVCYPGSRTVKAAFADGFNMKAISLDTPTGDGDLTIGDFQVCPAPLPEDVLVRYDENRRVRAALTHLDSREADIIEARLLRDEPLTLEVKGAELGISKERVRQIQNRALAKLKRKLVRA